MVNNLSNRWYAEDAAHISTPSYLPVLTEYLATNNIPPAKGCFRHLLVSSLPTHPTMIESKIGSTTRIHRMTLLVRQRAYHTKSSSVHIASTGWSCASTCAAVREIPDHHTAFLGPSGSGYAQGNFVASCSSCRKTTNKRLLGIYKFANDIVKSAGFLSYARLHPVATVSLSIFQQWNTAYS